MNRSVKARRLPQAGVWVLVLALALPPLQARAADEPLAAGVLRRPVPADTGWLVRAPAADKVAYQGVASFEDATMGRYGMLYPAPNLVGLLAAVVAHGVVSGAVQDKKRAAIREAADKVLAPYQPTLDTITHSTLLPQGLAKTRRGAGKTVVPAGEAETRQWLVETIPVYSMTQDQRALVLDNALVVRGPEAGAPVVYQNVVRVVSAPLPAGDDKPPVAGAWLADDGRLLKEVSADLFAESFDLMLGELAQGPQAQPAEDKPHKTVRYLEGGTVKMERATPVLERCDRAVLKTLRGWLMSVPRQLGVGEECAEAPADNKSAAAQ
jgi:hypothetical protein